MSKKTVKRRVAAKKVSQVGKRPSMLVLYGAAALIVGGAVWYGLNRSPQPVGINEVANVPSTAWKTVNEWNFDAKTDVGISAWRLVLQGNSNSAPLSVLSGVVDGGVYSYSGSLGNAQLTKKSLALWNRQFTYMVGDSPRTDISKLKVELTLAETIARTSAGGSTNKQEDDTTTPPMASPSPVDQKVVMELQSGNTWGSPVIVRKEATARLTTGVAKMNTYVYEIPSSELTKSVKAIRFYINPDGAYLTAVKVDRIAVSQEYFPVAVASTTPKTPATSVTLTGVLSTRSLEGRTACFFKSGADTYQVMLPVDMGSDAAPNTGKGSSNLSEGYQNGAAGTMIGSRDNPSRSTAPSAQSGCGAYAQYVGVQVSVQGTVNKAGSQPGVQPAYPSLRITSVTKI